MPPEKEGPPWKGGGTVPGTSPLGQAWWKSWVELVILEELLLLMLRRKLSVATVLLIVDIALQRHAGLQGWETDKEERERRREDFSTDGVGPWGKPTHLVAQINGGRELSEGHHKNW